MKIVKSSMLSLMFIALTGLVQIAVAAPPDAKDDGTNWCDGIDPSTGLYSTCIQTHSAANRVKHLQSKNASANAVAKALAEYDQAVAQFAELGGGDVPGFEPPIAASCPCWSEEEVAGIEGLTSTGEATNVTCNTGAWVPGTADYGIHEYPSPNYRDAAILYNSTQDTYRCFYRDQAHSSGDLVRILNISSEEAAGCAASVEQQCASIGQ